jgi:hypothetical protein
MARAKGRLIGTVLYGLPRASCRTWSLVCPRSDESADGCFGGQATMRSVPIVAMEPERQLGCSAIGMRVGPGVGPFAQRGLEAADGGWRDPPVRRQSACLALAAQSLDGGACGLRGFGLVRQLPSTPNLPFFQTHIQAPNSGSGPLRTYPGEVRDGIEPSTSTRALPGRRCR